ncbi:MAG: hypothetical protein H8D43_00350 [Chloroflexi bacterium]|nr:hypothetical protein [Chloroflexota bacterium]
MPEFMRDSIWEFVGVVVAAVAVLISVLIVLIQRRKKAVSYQVYSTSSLLDVANGLEDELQILFEGIPVRRLHLILALFTNTGNQPILPTDYVKQVTLSFSEGSKVLAAEVVETYPDSIDAMVETLDSNIVLTPVLLNGGDTITIIGLVSDYDGHIKVDGRITGVKEITKKSSLLNTSTIALLFSGIIMILLGIIGIIITNYALIDAIIANSYPYSIPVIAVEMGFWLMVIPIITDRRYRVILLSGRLRVGWRFSIGDLLSPASD